MARIWSTAVLSFRSGRKPPLPTLDMSGTFRGGTQPNRTFQKLILSSWDGLLFLPLKLIFLNRSFGGKSTFTYRTPSFLRAFYPQKWQSRRGLEEQPARPSTHLFNAPPMGTSSLHHHLPQLISVTCLPEIWVHHLVTPDWIQREEWVGRKHFEWVTFHKMLKMC